MLLPKDISSLSEIYRLHNINENEKENDMCKYRERVKLLHQVIEEGLKSVLSKAKIKI